ncbi:MAG: hypothetical protein NTY38_31760, partial [Acidobacteria bacterium]|nr:hypothetical protein [Acidobacteriota bacterium]
SLLLDSEAPLEALRRFVDQNPGLEDIRLVKYSLAVRLSREDRYEEAADLYASIYANRRAPRMRRLAGLAAEANRAGLTDAQRQEARYNLAQYISANPNGIYFNDALWYGLQNYALKAATGDRKLRDDQEERWRAYLILRDVVRESGHSELGRKAALLASRCLRGISERFGRQEEIRKADARLVRWLRQ